MIRPFFILLFLFSSSSVMAQASSGNEVKDADAKLNTLIIEHAAEKAAELYLDDFILTTSSGAVKLKQDMLKEISLPDLVLEINETSSVVVRIVDATAVLTGVLHQKGSYKGKAFDVKLLVTDTWIKTSQGWKILAGHASVITPK